MCVCLSAVRGRAAVLHQGGGSGRVPAGRAGRAAGRRVQLLPAERGSGGRAGRLTPVQVRARRRKRHREYIYICI